MSFSTLQNKSLCYCIILAFVICKVLTKNIEYVSVSYHLEVPREKNDTTVDISGRVYVKYDDFNIYPEFIVNYYYPFNLILF